MNLQLFEVVWDHDPDLKGFICDESLPGWIILNRLETNFSLDGFLLINESSVSFKRLVEKGDIYSKFVEEAKLKCEMPTVRGKNIFEIIQAICEVWGTVGIYKKDHGFDDLEIGVLDEVFEKHLSYRFVTNMGKVESSISKLKFSDILALSFGGRYENGLHKVIQHDGRSCEKLD